MSGSEKPSPITSRQMKKYAIIVAGGTGSRMGSAVPKQFLPLYGKPVLWYTIRAFFEAYPEILVVVVLPEAHLETGRTIAEEAAPAANTVIAAGGATRFESVRNGLQFVDDESIVFVHDAVRCLVTANLIRRCYDVAISLGNAVPAIAVSDTIRFQTDAGSALIDRSRVRLIQTPQTFKSGILKQAFRREFDEAFTDEAAVAERDGITIHLTEGETTNIKITTPLDMLIAEKILQERMPSNLASL